MTFIRSSKLLRRALVADAVVSGAVGALQVALTPWLDTVLALPASLLLGTGIFLLGYASVLIVMAASTALPAGLVWIVVCGNVGWGIAGAWLLIVGRVDPTVLGTAFVLVHIVAVLAFAIAEYFGLSRSSLARQHAMAAT